MGRCAGEREKLVAGSFSKNLRQLRERRRISRRVLSELCGLSKNSIARYERGERVPSLPDAAALADFFQVTLDDLWNPK